MKYEIEIEGLPEGWEPVAFRIPINGVDYVFEKGMVFLNGFDATFPRLIIKKKQPRKIVLEETDEHDGWNLVIGNLILDGKWREVKDADLSLTKEDSKLSLTVDELKSLLDAIDINVVRKIQQFLKDK